MLPQGQEFDIAAIFEDGENLEMGLHYGCEICTREDPDGGQKQIPWFQHDTRSMWYHQSCAKESWPPSLCPADDVTFLGENVVHVLPLINTI